MPVVNPGIRRFLGSAIQRLFNGASFSAPLTHSAIPTRAASGTTGTFTRATTATVRDNEGVLRTAIAGEARFEGARRVRNFSLGKTEDLTVAGGWALSNITTPGLATVTAPDGTTTGWVLTATANSAQWYRQCTGMTPNGTGLEHIWLRRNTGSGAVQLFNAAGAAAGDLGITTSWAQYSLPVTITAGGTAYLGIQINVSGDKVEVWHPQLEDITGRADQTTPSEYVSVGVPTDWLGTEHVTNGTFDSGTTGWTAGLSAVLSVVSNEMQIENGGASFGYAYTSITTVVGSKYVVSALSRVGTTVAIQLAAGTTPADTSLGSTSTASATNTLLTFTFTATGTTTYITFQNQTNTAGHTSYADNISVKPAIYHGAGVDGVKCFNTDLSGNPLPTAYTYDAVSLNGVAGTYVSTPDSVAASITGDIDIRVKAKPSLWTGLAATSDLISKWNSGGNSFLLRTQTNGQLTFYTSVGSVTGNASSSVSVSTAFNTGDTGWVRVTKSASTGVVAFYTSIDGVIWTSLGVPQTGTAGAIDDCTASIELSGYSASGDWAAKVYQAQIYNGIDGTLAVDFDASRYAGGTTLTGSTGETWTLQGNAVIHPTNNPMLGYLAEGARTNLTIWNRDLTNAAWTRRSGTVTTALTAVGADGAANSATAVRNLGASGVDDLYQTASYAVTAGVRVEPSLSLRAVSTSGTLRFANAYDVGASGAWNIDLSLVSTTRMERITRNHPSVTITSEWVGGSLNFVQPIFDTTTGPLNFDVDLIQVELGSFASSPIATTTAAVTRNGDVLTYSSSGNVSGTAGWCYAEISRSVLATGANTRVINTGVGGQTGPMLLEASTGQPRLYDGTTFATSGLGGISTSATNKIASTWGGSAMRIALNGTNGSSQAFDGDMGSDTLKIGSDTVAGDELFGNIKNVRIGQRQLSASELQAITA